MLLVFFRCDLFLVDKIIVLFYSDSALFAEVKWDLPHHHKRHRRSSIYPKTPSAAPPAPRYEQVPRANAKVSKIFLLRLWRSSLSCHHLDSSGIWIAAVKCCSGILLQLSASESGSLWSLWSFWAHVLWSLQSHVTCFCGCCRRRQAKHWCLPWQKCQRESPTSFKAFPDAITYFSES